MANRSRAGLVSGIALVLSVVALALAGLAVYRSEFSQPRYSEAQRSDAKARICSAVDVVRKGVALNTNLSPPGGPTDVTGALAVAANARVSLYDGGQYLLARLDPATPAELADAVRTFANQPMDIGAAATAGAPNTDPEQAARLTAAEAQDTAVTKLCA